MRHNCGVGVGVEIKCEEESFGYSLQNDYKLFIDTDSINGNKIGAECSQIK